MKLAIMQPYVFPYLGYFQLINTVDKFVVYDDVTYIKGGWINRNKILIGGKENLFTIPLSGASSNKEIKELLLNETNFPKWKSKFLKSLNQSYASAPHFDKAYPIVEEILNSSTNSISVLAYNSLKHICDYLDIKTEFVKSSAIYKNDNLSGIDRVLDICSIENSKHYINPIGGRILYDKRRFIEQGILLNFIKTDDIVYPQFNNKFVKNLSIIDILMFNSVEQIRQHLQKHELV